MDDVDDVGLAGGEISGGEGEVSEERKKKTQLLFLAQWPKPAAPMPATPDDG